MSWMVVLVALLAVVLPIVSRVVSSPLALLLILPPVLLFFLVTSLGLTLYLGNTLDAWQTASPNVNHVSRAAQPFRFATPAAWQAVHTRSLWLSDVQQPLPPLCPNAPKISVALDDIIAKIVRDFVSSWYQDFSKSPAFPVAVSKVIYASLENVLARAAAIDLPDFAVKRVLPKITAHVEQFRQSEVALRGAGLERSLTQSEELDLLLASRYEGKGRGKLHDAIGNLSTMFTKQTEEAHLRQLVDKALPYMLPEKESKSALLRIVVREIIACSVLYPVMEMVADPDFWNRTIDQVAGAAIHQQKLITKVRNVLEAQSPRRKSKGSTTHIPSVTAERITIRTDLRQFESFLRGISKCSSLLDARRLKNDVASEIRRTRILLANHENEDWINGEKTEDMVAFLDRLYTAKQKVEKRITVLGGGGESKHPNHPEPSPKSGLSLRDVLGNPGSLSYFMEFMDRRHRSLPLQFWLTVESFKNPLEAVDSGNSGDDEDPIQDMSTSQTIEEDISMIRDLYFATPTLHPTLTSISKKYIEQIRNFADDPSQGRAEKRRVRRYVLLAQKQIERDMEHDFEDFECSELWFRVIGDTNSASTVSHPRDTAADEFATPAPQPIATYPHKVYSLGSQSTSHPLGTRREDSHPGSSMQRTASAGSGRSSSSLNSVSGQPVQSSIEVLMAPISDASSDSPRAPLFNDPEDEQQRAEEMRMDAIQAALTDIMALEHGRDKSSPFPPESSHYHDSFQSSQESKRTRRAVFENSIPVAEDVDDIEPEAVPYQSFQLAVAGDLQLSNEIMRLADNISDIQVQEATLETLIKKAELTGDTQELRLLTRSKSAFSRELRQLKFQKLQYEQQESANRLLSDRTKVSIVNSTVGDEEGKSVVRYLIEVKQLVADGSIASEWIVARRYNEFFNLHSKLRERNMLVRSLDFPGKRLVTSLSGSFLDTRRAALEKYLQSIIAVPVICESGELRSFLSRDSPFLAAPPQRAAAKSTGGFSGTDLVRNVYRHFTASIDDMFFGPSMLDVMIQRLTRQAAEFAGIVGSGVHDEDLVAQALHGASDATFMQLTGDLKPLEGETGSSTFTAPICDLVLAVFELDKKNNWLRRQAIVIILQQVFGGTIERKIRENVKSLLEEKRLLSFIDLFRDGFWPGGKLQTATVPRTVEEKYRTRDEANRKLSSLVPDLAANMIGRSNARRGARRIFAVLQNRRLNQHIAYTIIDEIFSALFPESSTVTR